jgi:hypothetical protein
MSKAVIAQDGNAQHQVAVRYAFWNPAERDEFDVVIKKADEDAAAV